MKKNTVITALVGILAMAVTPAFAQEENGFKKFDGYNAESLYCSESTEWMSSLSVMQCLIVQFQR